MEAISAPAIEVEDLDSSGLLEAASEAERLDRMVQHRKLAIAYPVVCRTPGHRRVRYGDLGRHGSARAG